VDYLIPIQTLTFYSITWSGPSRRVVNMSTLGRRAPRRWPTAPWR